MKILSNFHHFTKDNIQNQDAVLSKLAVAYGIFARSNKEKDFERICDLFRQCGIKDHHGIVTTTFDVINKTCYKDKVQRVRALSESEWLHKVNDIQVVANLDGTWDAGQPPVVGTWLSRTVVYVSNEMQNDWGTCAINNGNNKFCATSMMLRNDTTNQFELITKAPKSGLQFYQVDGKGKNRKWKELNESFDGRGYGIVLVCYELRELSPDQSNSCGGFRMMRKSKQLVSRVANTNSEEGEDRSCFVYALGRYLQEKRIKNSDGNQYDLETLRKGFVEELKIEPGTNIHAQTISYFLREGGARILGENNVGRFVLDKRLGRFVTHKDKVNQGPTHNKIFAQKSGDYFILVSFGAKNETKAPDKNRHVLYFCGRQRNSTVSDGDEEVYEIEGDEGADDEVMQQMLQRIWKDSNQKYEVVNVWEITDTH